MKSTVTLALALVIGCTDLPTYDDPRNSVEYLESGTCDGSTSRCESRSASQCDNGCAVTQGCYSPVLARCTSYRDGNSCETDQSCDWRSYPDRCEPSDICDLWEFEVECMRASSPCLWGAVCRGEAKQCSDFDTLPDCQANPTCAWTHEP